MRAICVLLIVFGCGQFTLAQLSPEEAYRKLQQREKERAAAAAAAATQPAAESEPVARPSGLAVGKLLHQGWQALAEKHYGEASTIFDKAAAIDAGDANALQGRGICKYELKQSKPADKDLQKAYELSSAGGPGKVSRQLVIAAAAGSVANDNPMRAVKVLRGLMESMEQDSRLDEELQNDLGIALSHANPQTKKLPLFAESLKYYMEYDKKLNEQKKDGTARWGPKWVSTKDAEEKWKTYQRASTVANDAVVNADHATLARIHSYDHYLELHGLRLHSDAEIKMYMDEYKQSLIDEAAAQKQMNKALEKLSKVDKPPFPDTIEHDWAEPL
jgi:tetratricopeptide (TPR) repeat protein